MISKAEKEDAKKFKETLERRQKKAEEETERRERALLKYLKEKYEN